jgi:nucleoside 2-deoxyribosyltransferase
MIDVVGGTYFEFCKEPNWFQIFGSGGRAAAAISRLTKRVRLHTYTSGAAQPHVTALANTFGFTVDSHQAETSITFLFGHPLGVPTIRPSLRRIRRLDPIRVAGHVILRFGMLEGEAIVQGDRVVYDPQSSHDPRPFSENGSMAKRLAIVANSAEAEVLSGKNNLRAAARAILTKENASAVVIKRGAHGAFVLTPTYTGFVPAFATDRVWPIGSGDVFSAAFAYYWGEEGKAVTTAARLASIATAYYCETASLPIPRDPHATLGRRLAPILTRKVGNPRPVYLAGPFFTMSQRWLIGEVRDALLGAGAPVFSPFHDVGIGAAEDVVAADLAALDKCSVVLALLDGGDEGTLFEVGYARARGTPVIGFVQNESPEAVKMLAGTDCLLVGDFSTAVYRACWLALAS